MGEFFRTEKGKGIIYDLLGFGVTRTIMDLFRLKFMNKKSLVDTKEKTNTPLARERAIRELAHQFNASFAAGLTFLAALWAANKLQLQKHMAKDFLSYETLILFRKHLKPSSSKAQFLKELSQKIALDYSQTKHASHIQNILNSGTQVKALKGEATQKIFNKLGKELVNIVAPKQSDFSLTLNLKSLGSHEFNAPTLIKDIAYLNNKIGKQPWRKNAFKLIKQTQRVNRWFTLPAIGVAALLTAAVPFYNKYITKKKDNLSKYPGQLGLRARKDLSVNEGTREQPWWVKTFPYIHKTLSKGNAWPLLLSLPALPFAIGVFDSAAVFRGNWTKIAMNPLKKGHYARLLQFSKLFPYITLRQIGLLSAIVNVMRHLTSRDKIEFRERVIDAQGGIITWFALVPWIERGYTRMLHNKHPELHLLKKSGDRLLSRSSEELTTFFPKVANKALSKTKNIGLTSLGLMILLVGLFEPWIAAKWTENQINSEKNKALENKTKKLLAKLQQHE